VTEARNIIKALKAVGGDATLTEFKGLNHIKASVKAHSQLDAISWLLEQRRGGHSCLSTVAPPFSRFAGIVGLTIGVFGVS
jgi:hypothetical protein